MASTRGISRASFPGRVDCRRTADRRRAHSGGFAGEGNTSVLLTARGWSVHARAEARVVVQQSRSEVHAAARTPSGASRHLPQQSWGRGANAHSPPISTNAAPGGERQFRREPDRPQRGQRLPFPMRPLPTPRDPPQVGVPSSRPPRLTSPRRPAPAPASRTPRARRVPGRGRRGSSRRCWRSPACGRDR